MESVFYGFKTQKIMTEQDENYVIEALEYALHKCINLNGDAETHYNTLANAIEVVKNYSIPYVVRQSEQLKGVEKLKDFAYEVCPLHREDDLEEIVGSL